MTDAQMELLLARELNRAMIDEGQSLGQALITAKRALLDRYDEGRVRDVLAGYLLPGNPGLKLALPAQQGLTGQGQSQRRPTTIRVERLFLPPGYCHQLAHGSGLPLDWSGLYDACA